MKFSIAVMGMLFPFSSISANISSLDQQFYDSFTQQAEAIAKAHLPSNQSGLIGRNKKWGAMYSPRFQLGAGFALRITLVAQHKEAAQRAFSAIEVATTAIGESGKVDSTVPAHISKGRQPSDRDLASAAAFFLGDACLGINALQKAKPDVHGISMVKISRSASQLAKAANWLTEQVPVLKKADANAPNRLLFNARAFAACALLEPNDVLRNQYNQLGFEFFQLALQRLDEQDYFIEGGGFDISYQAVAIVLAEELIAIAPPLSDASRQDITRASMWLAQRIDQSGRLNSSGNTRTCAGGEQFLGQHKKVALVDVFKALALNGIRTNNQSMLNKAMQLASWVESHKTLPSFDPCYEAD